MWHCVAVKRTSRLPAQAYVINCERESMVVILQNNQSLGVEIRPRTNCTACCRRFQDLASYWQPGGWSRRCANLLNNRDVAK
jgi:hypothetical protein